MGSINFADPANIRKVHEELTSQIRTKAIHISSKYKIQIEPIHFEWDTLPPTLEKNFPEILNDVLSHNNNQHHIPNSNENRSTQNEDQNQYNTEIHNRGRTLTTPSPFGNT